MLRTDSHNVKFP